MSDFAFRIIADTKAYQAELAKIPGATEKTAFQAAQRMAMATEKGGREAGKKAGEALAKGMSSATRAGAINFGNQISDVFSQLTTGTSPMTILIQQGPQAAGALGMMGAAGAATAAAVGVLTVAVGAGYTAWKVYNEETDAAQRIVDLVSAAHKELAPLIDATRDATLRLRVATGELSPLMGELETNSRRAMKEWGAATDETRGKVAELRKEQAGAVAEFLDAFERPAGTPLGAIIGETIDAYTTSASELTPQIDALNHEISRSILVLDENEQKTRDTIVADNAAKLAKERRTEAEKAHREEVERNRKAWAAGQADAEAEISRQDRITKALIDLDAAAHKSYLSRLSGEQAIAAALGDTIAEINKTEATEIQFAHSVEESTAIQMRAEEARKQAILTSEVDIAKARADAAEKARRDADKLAKKEMEIARQVADAKAAVATASVDAIASLTDQAYESQARRADKLNQELEDGYGQLTKAETEQIQRRLAGSKRAALALFIISRASAAAQAGVNTYLAISNALASAPPPANAALAIAAGIAGGAQVAGILATAPPSFHRGSQGIAGRRDEMLAVVEPGEAMIPKSAAKDPRNQDAIARMRGDRGADAPMVIAVDRYNGRAFGQGIRDQIRYGGALRQALAVTTPHLGHR